MNTPDIAAVLRASRSCVPQKFIQMAATEIEALRKEVAMLKESRAAIVEQEQKSRNECNQLRDRLKANSVAARKFITSLKSMLADPQTTVGHIREAILQGVPTLPDVEPRTDN